MEDKYILGSLCSTTPVLKRDGRRCWGVGSLRHNSKNRLTLDLLMIVDRNQIYQENAIIGKLLIPKNELTVENIPAKKISNKDELCMTTFAKYRILHTILHNYGSLNGIHLLQRNTKLKNYIGYSMDIRDYKNNYDFRTIRNFLTIINKLIIQNSKCISAYQIGVFKSILKMLLKLYPSVKFTDKITTTLLNDQIFSNVFYKYIRSMDYYINLGELFKDV